MLKRGRGRIAALAIAALLTVGVGSASGSTGTFTKAIATTDWSHGSFAGSVTWTECATNCGGWLAVVEVQPTTIPCAATEWAESNPNIRMVWDSLGQHGSVTVPFEVNEAEILRGVYGQRLCLIGIQSYQSTYPPSAQLLANAIMEVAAPPAPAAPAPPVVTTPTPPPPSTPTTACVIAGKEVKRLQVKLSTARRRGARSRILTADRAALAKAKKRQEAQC